jgi:hypothetical protein
VNRSQVHGSPRNKNPHRRTPRVLWQKRRLNSRVNLPARRPVTNGSMIARQPRKEVSPPPVKPTKPKRMTLDLSDDLHRRIKLACTVRGSKMVEEIRSSWKRSLLRSRGLAGLRRAPLRLLLLLSHRLFGKPDHTRLLVPRCKDRTELRLF